MRRCKQEKRVLEAQVRELVNTNFSLRERIRELEGALTHRTEELRTAKDASGSS